MTSLYSQITLGNNLIEELLSIQGTVFDGKGNFRLVVSIAGVIMILLTYLTFH